ncbi:unnamed protein product [Parnassius mnemosyne]|uniref:Tc1-like transposase DDE domain-containing protein n=1 Tax=Parnassius mnemosyne TaxID=213953 RepID=A0AAV1M6U7_9NEOP
MQNIKIEATKKYIVDNLMKERGYEVLCVPYVARPYHWDLYPIECIWNLVKQRVADKNIIQSKKEIEKLTFGLKKEINHVERLEQNYWDSDHLEERNQREIIISLGGENSSDSDSESKTMSVTDKS